MIPSLTNDEDLLNALRRGDPSALESVFRLHQSAVFRHLLYRVRDPELAHDLVQDAFVRLWDHRTHLKPQTPVLPYLLTIANHLLIDHRKHEQIRRTHEPLVQPTRASDSENPELATREAILQEMLIACVNRKLPEGCRNVFIMSRIDGIPNPEIARRLGIAPKTVENHLNKALKILKKHLAPYL